MPEALSKAVIAVLALALALASATGDAATPLLISPTLVEIAPTRKSGSIQVTNQSDVAVDLQMRGYDWLQPNGLDKLQPSETIVVSPAIATVPPGGRQLFRILVPVQPAATEQAFRVRINQLPRRDGPGAVAINLEFLVPVFRQAAGNAAAPRWTQSSAGVTFENAGTRHLKLADVTMIGSDGTKSSRTLPGSSYVLAGTARTMPAPAFPIVKFVATTDTGRIDVVRADAAR